MHEGAVEEGIALAEHGDGAAGLDLAASARCGFLVEGVDGGGVSGMRPPAISVVTG